MVVEAVVNNSSSCSGDDKLSNRAAVATADMLYLSLP